MTVVLIDPDAVPPCELELPYAKEIARVRTHRAEGKDDLCVECGRHWPCPSYFQDRYTLIRARVNPVLWAAPWPQTWRTRWGDPTP